MVRADGLLYEGYTLSKGIFESRRWPDWIAAIDICTIARLDWIAAIDIYTIVFIYIYIYI